MQVTPLLASILLQFQDRGSWPAAELAASLGTSPDALRRKIIFWINQGVLSESKAPDGGLTYARNESLQTSGAMAGDADMMADMDEAAGRDTGLQVMYYHYLQTTLGGLCRPMQLHTSSIDLLSGFTSLPISTCDPCWRLLPPLPLAAGHGQVRALHHGHAHQLRLPPTRPHPQHAQGIPLVPCRSRAVEGCTWTLLCERNHARHPDLTGRPPTTVLQMFVTDPPYDKSTDQLGTYLAAMVVEEKLNFEGGAYRKR